MLKGGVFLNERVKELRKALGLSREDFANKLGLKSRGKIENIELGRTIPDEPFLDLICKTYSVNSEWLHTGNGEMFVKLSEDEEIADLVSDVLEDGKNNSFYGIILEIVRTYNELSPASQEVMKDFSKKLVENIKKED